MRPGGVSDADMLGTAAGLCGGGGLAGGGGGPGPGGSAPLLRSPPPAEHGPRPGETEAPHTSHSPVVDCLLLYTPNMAPLSRSGNEYILHLTRLVCRVCSRYTPYYCSAGRDISVERGPTVFQI